MDAYEEVLILYSCGNNNQNLHLIGCKVKNKP